LGGLAEGVTRLFIAGELGLRCALLALTLRPSLPKPTVASVRGADGGRVGTHHRVWVRDEVWELLKKSERQQHVHHLLAVARLLHVGDPTAAATARRLRIT
jgi:hypothetical protein